MSNGMTSPDKDLENIALNVLGKYGIAPESLHLIQSGTIKTVWKLKSKGRYLCLKRLKQTLDKALFSVNAQIYIKNSGGKVPEVILNKEQKPITQYNDQLFVLYEWIHGSDLNFSSPMDLRKAIQGLAAFHIATKGYIAPEDSRISSKLGKWPEQYKSMKNKFISWKEIADRNLSQPHYLSYSNNAASMIRIADEAIERIDKSDYALLAAWGSDSVVLCHQDFGAGNALSTETGVFVLDLDGVTFDLPARDLRKIIGKNAENAGQWRNDTIEEILGWYTEVNPLTDKEIETLYADLTYPHWFFGLVKNLFQNGKTVKASAIEKMAKLEESKMSCLLRN